MLHNKKEENHLFYTCLFTISQYLNIENEKEKFFDTRRCHDIGWIRKDTNFDGLSVLVIGWCQRGIEITLMDGKRSVAENVVDGALQ